MIQSGEKPCMLCWTPWIKIYWINQWNTIRDEGRNRTIEWILYILKVPSSVLEIVTERFSGSSCCKRSVKQIHGRRDTEGVASHCGQNYSRHRTMLTGCKKTANAYLMPAHIISHIDSYQIISLLLIKSAFVGRLVIDSTSPLLSFSPVNRQIERKCGAGWAWEYTGGGAHECVVRIVGHRETATS